RPFGADELAQAQAQRIGVVGATVLVLEVEADRAGHVPAVIEFLRGCRVAHAEAAEERKSKEFGLRHFRFLERTCHRTATPRTADATSVPCVWASRRTHAERTAAA